jgi:hypothetical protein
MKTAVVICGALTREVQDIINRRGWDAEVFAVSALDHLFPEQIAPNVEAQILALQERYERVIVVYGDCGTGGALDAVLVHHGIERVAGPNCYEMYSGSLFQEIMAEEPGTFVLTDFLVRAFRGTVIRGLGLDRFPDLKNDYFRNYQRVFYLAQTRDPDLWEKAKRIADYLELPLEIRYTGYDLLEARMVALMENGQALQKSSVLHKDSPQEPLTGASPVSSASRLAKSRRRTQGGSGRVRGGPQT